MFSRVMPSGSTHVCKSARIAKQTGDCIEEWLRLLWSNNYTGTGLSYNSPHFTVRIDGCNKRPPCTHQRHSFRGEYNVGHRTLLGNQTYVSGSKHFKKLVLPQNWKKPDIVKISRCRSCFQFASHRTISHQQIDNLGMISR